MKFKKGDIVIYLGGNFTIPKENECCPAIVTKTGLGYSGEWYEIVFTFVKYICHETHLIAKKPLRTKTGTQWWV